MRLGHTSKVCMNIWGSGKTGKLFNLPKLSFKSIVFKVLFIRMVFLGI